VFSVPVSELNVEHLFIRISIGLSSFIVCGVYISLKSPHSNYESHINSIDHLKHLYPEDTFIICGDFNLPEVSWCNDDCGLTFSYTSTARAPCIPETFATNWFYQHNNIPNATSSTLDLVFCTD